MTYLLNYLLNLTSPRGAFTPKKSPSDLWAGELGISQRIVHILVNIYLYAKKDGQYTCEDMK